MLLSGRGLSPEREEPLSVSAPIGSSTLVAIPFTNPMELTVELDVSIKGHPPPHPNYRFITIVTYQLMTSALQSGVDPSGDATARLVGTKEEEKVFSVCLIPAKGTFTRTK